MTFFKYLFSAKARAEAEAALAKVAADEERANFLRNRPHLSSKLVSTTEAKYKFVFLGEDFSSEEYDNAYAELAVFYEFCYGTKEGMEDAIKVAVMDGEIVLRFRDTSEGVSHSGTGWNPLIYPNIIHVEDVLNGRMDMRGVKLK